MNIAVFDLETNGLVGSSVLSASSIVFDGEGNILELFNRFYLPLERPNEHAVRVHGLTPGRLLELRKNVETPLYFLEDWPDLLSFWDDWGVGGVVVHNLSFDASFLPEIAQGAYLWWCSMKGLATYCAIPKRSVNRGAAGSFKWPKLGEAADIICNGPGALPPPKATKRAENALGNEFPHVSLFDCFELYRMVTRIVRHHKDLLRFAPVCVPFRPPKFRIHETRKMRISPLRDSFTTNILTYEQKLRSLRKGR